MLKADRDAIDADLKAQAVQIRNMEMLNIDRYLQAIGTQAALILGFAATESYAVEISSTANKFFAWGYYLCSTISLVSEMYCVMTATMVSVLGPTFALNGPTGSMNEAVDSMKSERMTILYSFILGAWFFSFAQIFCLFMKARTEIAVICSLTILGGFVVVYKAMTRIGRTLHHHHVYGTKEKKVIIQESVSALQFLREKR